MTKHAMDAKEFVKALEDFRREIRAELRTLKESVKFCSDTCDGVKEIGSDVKELRKEMQSLVRSNHELRVENEKLSARIDELEQYQRLNNLELKGLPLDGDPSDIVRKIGDAVGESISEADIDICHRVATSKPSQKNIIVRFVSRSKRNTVLTKSKKKRIDTTSLGLPGPTTAVYVNEHLTRKNKQLLGAAIARKREVRWRFVWSSGGKILARKDENADAVKIDSLADLEKMRM